MFFCSGGWGVKYPACDRKCWLSSSISTIYHFVWKRRQRCSEPFKAKEMNAQNYRQSFKPRKDKLEQWILKCLIPVLAPSPFKIPLNKLKQIKINRQRREGRIFQSPSLSTRAEMWWGRVEQRPENVKLTDLEEKKNKGKCVSGVKVSLSVWTCLSYPRT